MAAYERERHVREVREEDPLPPPVDVRQDRYVERDIVERDVYTGPGYDGRRILYSKISNIVWTITGLIEALIGLRIVLRLLGANEANGFVDFIYNLSWVFVSPFQGIVSDPASEGNVLEINSVIAAIVYLIAAWVIMRLIALIIDISEPTRA